MRTNKGYTLLEIMLVISITALLGGAVLISVQSSRAKARDTKRIADMGAIREALGWFYRDHGRYPGGADGINTGFEFLGVGDDIDVALLPYFPRGVVPIDPRHDGVTHYYAYDPVHDVRDCETNKRRDRGVAVSINRFEGNPSSGAHKETCRGNDGNINNADFNFVLWPSSP